MGKLNSSDSSEFTRIKYLYLQNTYYIGVGLIGGFQLWTNDATRLIFHIPCKNKNPDKLYCFYAISEFKNNEKSTTFDSVVCGDNFGQIFLVSGSNQNWRSKLIYNYNNVTATDIKCDENLDIIVCSFETGEIYILKLKGDSAEIIAKFDNILNLPVISLGILSSPKSLLVAGYANGEIKVYTLEKTFDLVISIGSHLRMINAVDVLSNLGVFVTVGDDCYVNIFKIENDLTLSLQGNFDLVHKTPIGVSLFNNKDNNVDCLVTTYDNPHLIYFENIIIK